MTRGMVACGVVGAGLLLSSWVQAAADEVPPKSAKPLSEVLRGIEQHGYTPVISVYLENGRWQLQAFKAGQKRALKVDPLSGRIISDKQDY